MRCGLVRLVTRRCPYDVKNRRKVWNTVQKGVEVSALKEVAESRVIGRLCAHKMCRLVDKSSKLISRVSSGNNIICRKMSTAKSSFFGEESDNINHLSLKSKEALDRHLKFRLSSTVCSQASKFVVKLQNCPTKSIEQNENNKKSTRTICYISKPKVYNYKRYSSNKLPSKRNLCTSKFYKRKGKYPALKNLYVIQSPVTYTDFKDNKYLRTLKQHSNYPDNNLDKPDFGQGILDDNVLNYLNETSYLSLCGCDICEKKFKKYEKKNNKINKLLQNKISKILNYCKKKNPFYKIYNQNDNKNNIDMKELGMHGINGWLNFDSGECTDWLQYKLSANKNISPHQSTKNKCVNTNDEFSDSNDNITKINDINLTHHKNDKVDLHVGSTFNKSNLLKQSNTEFKTQAHGKTDNSTTQTQDFCEPQVTNYYYITNNTLNTNFSSKDEFAHEPSRDNESCSKSQNENPNNNLKTNDSHVGKHNSDKKELKRSTALNNICKTINQVYDVMLRPINKNKTEKLGHELCDDNFKMDKVCKANNFENYDDTTYRPYDVNFVKNDCKTTSNDQVLNFDEYMDIKSRELKECSRDENRFMQFDALEFKELIKKAGDTVQDHENYSRQCPSSSKCNLFNNPVKHKPLKKRLDHKWEKDEFLGTKNYNLLDDYDTKAEMKSKYVNTISAHELGPLDPVNKFLSKNIERYEENEKIISKGPNFSQFPESNWRSSLFRRDNKLSKTFDVRYPNSSNVPIKTATSSVTDWPKYSEINMAIEKVRKKIHNIINESDENILVSREAPVKSSKSDGKNKCLQTALLNHSDQYEVDPSALIMNDKYSGKLGNNNVRGRRNDHFMARQKIYSYRNNYSGCNGVSNQTTHPPSSVHLNEIIEAIKENQNCNKPESKVNRSELDDTKSKNDRLYGAPRNLRRIPLRNNIFIRNPNPDPFFCSFGRDLVNTGEIPRFMSTSSKNKLFYGNEINKINNKSNKSNSRDKTTFSTDNIIVEEWENKNKSKLMKNIPYAKHMDNTINQEPRYKMFEHGMLKIPGSKINRPYSSAEPTDDNQKSCIEELFNKSMELFKQNNELEKTRKTEYSPIPNLLRVVNRYNAKLPYSKERLISYEYNTDKAPNKAGWKICGSKDWPNQGDRYHAAMISKCFCDGETDKGNGKNRGEILFNERIKKGEQVERVFDENCAGAKDVMNNNSGRRFDRFDCRPSNHSGVDNPNCVNVGELGLNFTSFSIEELEKKKYKKGKAGVETSMPKVGKSVHGSEGRINNVGIANTSMSRQPDLHLRQIRTVGLRPCNKKDLHTDPFRPRNSFFINGKNTLRPVSSNDSTGETKFKLTMSDKLKNIERIDQVDYSKEEKYISEKEAVQSIKTKEIYVSPENKMESSFDTIGQSEVQSYHRFSVCSKEIEKKIKNRATGDINLTKQITEEINVSGVFPEGKKSVHGKMVNVLAKPKTVFTTSPKNRNKGSEAIQKSEFKDPITVQVVYETMLDNSVGEHIDKAKRKIFVGDIEKRKPITNSANLTDNKYDNEIDKKQRGLLDKENKMTTTKRDSSEDGTHKTKKNYSNISRFDGEYDVESFADFMKLMKKEKMKNKDTGLKKSKYPEEDVYQKLYWQAPRNIVLEKLIRQEDFSEWMQKSDNDKYQVKNDSSMEDTNANDKVSFRNEKEAKDKAQSGKSYHNQLKELKITSTEKDSSSNHNVPTSIINDNSLGNSKIINGDIKGIEGKEDKSTSGEVKYEIDSDYFDNTESSTDNGKLIITHFKQFGRANDKVDSSKKKDQQNFVLEASMMKLTVVQESKTEKVKNMDKTQSIERLSEEVERELNDLISPYIKDLIANEAVTRKNDKVLFKSNNYFLEMLSPNYESAKNLENNKNDPQKVKAMNTNIETVKSDKEQKKEETRRSSIELINTKKIMPHHHHPNEEIVKMKTDEGAHVKEENEEFRTSKNKESNLIHAKEIKNTKDELKLKKEIGNMKSKVVSDRTSEETRRSSIEQINTKKIMPQHHHNEELVKMKTDERPHAKEENEEFRTFRDKEGNLIHAKEIKNVKDELMLKKEMGNMKSKVVSDRTSSQSSREIHESSKEEIIPKNTQGKINMKLKQSSTRYDEICEELKNSFDNRSQQPNERRQPFKEDEKTTISKTQGIMPSNEINQENFQKLKEASRINIKEYEVNKDDSLSNDARGRIIGDMKQTKPDERLSHIKNNSEESSSSENKGMIDKNAIQREESKDDVLLTKEMGNKSKEEVKKSQQVSSETPKISSGGLNDIPKINNIQEKRKMKSKLSPNRYGNAVKDLNKLFVKDESKALQKEIKSQPFGEEDNEIIKIPRILLKDSNELKEEASRSLAIKSNDKEILIEEDLTEAPSNYNDQQPLEEKEKREKTNRLAQPNSTKADVAKSEPLIQFNFKPISKEIVNETNKLDAKNKIKGVFKSYESTNKPKLFEARYKKWPQENLTKVSKTVSKEDVLKNEKQVSMKSKIPIAKPEDTKPRSYYSAESSVKRSTQEKKLKDKQEDKNIEKKSSKEDYTETNKETTVISKGPDSDNELVNGSKSIVDATAKSFYSYDSSLKLEDQKKEQHGTVNVKEEKKSIEDDNIKEAKDNKADLVDISESTTKEESTEDKIQSKEHDLHLKYSSENVEATTKHTDVEMAHAKGERENDLNEIGEEPKKLTSAKLEIEKMEQESKKVFQEIFKEHSKEHESKIPQKSSEPETQKEKAEEISSVSEEDVAAQKMPATSPKKFVDTVEESKKFKRQTKSKNGKVVKHADFVYRDNVKKIETMPKPKVASEESTSIISDDHKELPVEVKKEKPQNVINSKLKIYKSYISLLKKPLSKEILVDDEIQSVEKEENAQNISTGQVKTADKETKVEPPEEDFVIAASSFNQYKESEEETLNKIKELGQQDFKPPTDSPEEKKVQNETLLSKRKELEQDHKPPTESPEEKNVRNEPLLNKEKDIEQEDHEPLTDSQEEKKVIYEKMLNKMRELEPDHKPSTDSPGEKSIKNIKQKRKLIKPPDEPKQYVPYNSMKTSEKESWEKLPAYFKRVKPTSFKTKKLEARQKNIEDNRRQFKELKILNKITNINKVSNSPGGKYANWEASISCSLQEDKDKEVSEEPPKAALPQDSQKYTKPPRSKVKGVARLRRGYRSAEWPENLSRKKEAVIKPPSTPKPPWRN